ncbi:hypothetical protein BSKO_12579 [Bryopsis sp. KO-2023]|nr:hypothetical protein BSKO_12579 [Bryopsis sp. KO-2023]
MLAAQTGRVLRRKKSRDRLITIIIVKSQFLNVSALTRVDSEADVAQPLKEEIREIPDQLATKNALAERRALRRARRGREEGLAGWSVSPKLMVLSESKLFELSKVNSDVFGNGPVAQKIVSEDGEGPSDANAQQADPPQTTKTSITRRCPARMTISQELKTVRVEVFFSQIQMKFVLEDGIKKPPRNNHSDDGNENQMVMFSKLSSALLGLIGISRKGQRSVVFTFDWLQKLCMKSVFGKNLPANERVFFVLCDSVAKQLDGLKEQNPYVGHSIRKLSMALEERNFEETSEESGVTPSGPSYAVSEAESMATSVDLDACEVTENELVPLVRAKLTEWEGLVKSYQNSMC